MRWIENSRRQRASRMAAVFVWAATGALASVSGSEPLTKARVKPSGATDRRSQSQPTSAPDRRPFSLERELLRIRKKEKIPAIAAAVVRDGKTIAAAATGVRQARSKVNVTINDRFHLGSCTKSMTATLCAMLVEEGKLRWSSTVGDVFGDLKEGMDPGFRDVTLEQLLCHRSGLPDDHAPDFTIMPKLFAMTGEMRSQRREMVKLVLGRPPASAKGSTFAYSNHGFAIAGAMCEAVTGETYESLLRRRLFDPLGMSTAGFGAPGSPDQVDEPRGHRKMLAWYTSVAPGPGSDNPAVIGPAGTAHCSIGDWAKYAALHLEASRGRPRLLKAETFEKLHGDPYSQGYAFGWGLVEKEWAGGKVWAHDGSNTLWYSVIVIAPKRNVVFVVMTNTASDDAVSACREAIRAMQGEFAR